MRPFFGQRRRDGWLKKVKLVAKLQGIQGVASLQPLYLEDSALNLYWEMSENDQQKIEKIEEGLKVAYTRGTFQTYSKLGRAKWAGEQVDNYASEIMSGEAMERIGRVGLCNWIPWLHFDQFAPATNQVI